MKVTYVSHDGFSFSTAEECLEHEKSHLCYRMYDGEGNPVYDAEDARLVYIYPDGATKLREDLEEADCSYSGISFWATGWYYVCSCCEWNKIPDEYIKLFCQEKD